jgi:phosphatidylglycerophosphatase A
MQSSGFIFKLAKFISTFGFIGLIKFAPGTFGSIAAFPVAYGIIILSSKLSGLGLLEFSGLSHAMQDITLIAVLQLATIILLFIIGVIASDYYANISQSQDPKEVVIDEVVGQLITVNLCFLGYLFITKSNLETWLSPEGLILVFLVALPFALFRIFDILKPWPIDWMDKNIKGGLGIMLDDVGAAIFATVIYYVIIFSLLDVFGYST